MTMSNIEAMETEYLSLNQRLYACRNGNKLLELTEDALKCSETKVVYYTGMVNCRILCALFNVVRGVYVT